MDTAEGWRRSGWKDAWFRRHDVEGIGLGPYMVKALAEGQGGILPVASTKGEDSTFSDTVRTAASSR